MKKISVQNRDLKTDPDFEITNEIIKSVKEDICRFKKESGDRYSKWFNSQTDEQEKFVTDYMAGRKLTCGFEFYNQLAYVCMCRDWDLNPIESKWYEKDDLRNIRLQPTLGSDTRNLSRLRGLRSKKNRQ